MYRILLTILLSIFISFGFTSAQKITWVRTNKSLDGNINKVAVQDGTIFAATVKGVYKSTDKGESWFLSNAGLNNTKVYALAVKNANEIYCGTFDGVYYSDDKGASWTKRNEGITDKYITEIYIKDDSTLFTGTLYSGMFISNNGGISWSKVKGDFENMAVNAFAVRSTGEIYVGTTSALYRSDANGQNYIKMKNNLPQTLNVYTISIRKNGIVYFGTRNGQLFRTINNGNSWTLQFEVPEKNQIYSSLITPNGALLIGTYGDGVYRSNDNAVTWETINDGLSNLKIMSITQDNNGDFYVGTWGDGVFKGFEPPITTSASGTYCAGEDLEVSFSLKAGNTINNDNIFYVEISDENGSFNKPDTIGFVQSNQAGTIFCTLPKDLKTGKHNVRVVASSPETVGSGAVITIQELPYMHFTGKTKVCPNAIEQYGIPSSTDIRSLWFVDGGVIKSPSTTDTIDVEWQYSQNASITLVRYNIFTQCSDTLIKPVKFNQVPEKPTITRMDNLLVSSANTGNQWYSFGKLLPGETDKILELKEPGLYTVQVTNEDGCKSEFSDIYDYNVNSVEDAELAKLIDIYPVPTNGKINVKFNLDNPVNVSITVYSIAGEKTSEYKTGFIQSDLRAIDISAFSNGVYYFKIDIGDKSIIKKVILQK